jgi:(p)ppGpp synthase/HD superfamily hydrolase
MMRLDLPDDMIVAVLHDVVEDCPEWPLARIEADGFSSAVIEALIALTRRKDESYKAFIERITPIALARRVKLADIGDNMDPARIGRLSASLQEQLRRKYGAAERALF